MADVTALDVLAAAKGALEEGFFRCFEPGSRGFRRRAQPPGAALEPPALRPADWARIGRQVMTLHEGYTSGGAEFAQGANPIHENLAGYQFYYLPRNFHRVWCVLQALPWQRPSGPELLRPWLEPGGAGGVLRILDLGCGSGAFSLAVLCWLGRSVGRGGPMPELRLTMVDQSRHLLDLAESNVRALWRRLGFGAALRIDARASGVEQYLKGRPRDEQFGIAGAAMMLNELNLRAPRRSGKRAVRIVEPLRQLLRPRALGLMVEPGTRKGYMNLMLVREQARDLPILYPCPHAGPCPMWDAQVTRWCHATFPVGAGFFFDEQLKRHGRLEFSMRELNALAFAFQGLPGAAPGRGARRGVARAPEAPFAARSGARIVSGKIPGAQPGPRASGSPRPPRTVLVCDADGTLSERPALGGLAGPGVRRGSWLEQPVQNPRAPARRR